MVKTALCIHACFIENESAAVELTRKAIANTFWNHELEEEVRETKLEDFSFKCVSDREKAMERIDEIRAESIYKHDKCSEECKLRGR